MLLRPTKKKKKRNQKSTKRLVHFALEVSEYFSLQISIILRRFKNNSLTQKDYMNNIKTVGDGTKLCTTLNRLG